MDSFLFIALSLMIIIFMMIIRKKSGKKTPPGPPGLPLIGNFLQFHPTDLHLRLSQLSKKYGPLMSMNIAITPVVVISSAKVAKQALKDNDLAFSGRPYSVSSAKVSYNNRDIITSTYSSYWREMKKLVTIHLFTHKQVHSFRPIRDEEVSSMVKEISRKADSGEIINLSEDTLSLSNRIICRVAFGKKNIDINRFTKVFKNVRTMSVTLFWADFHPSLGWIDKLTGRASRLEKVFKDMDSFCQELVEEHLDPNRPKSMDGDILDTLIQLRDEQKSSASIDWEDIKGVLMNVILAGTDTNAIALVWSMTALAKNPRVMKIAQTEIRNLVGDKGKVDEDDIEKLPYLKAIVKETLRFYPPAPLSVPKETIEKCTINGYEIPPKAIVYVNLWAIGRDPESWENPDEFFPERFMNSTVDVKGHDFGLIPFGSGRRICPGLGLAVATVELALANLLYSFEWKLPVGMREEDIDTQASPGLSSSKKIPLCLVAKSYI